MGSNEIRVQREGTVYMKMKMAALERLAKRELRKSTVK